MSNKTLKNIQIIILLFTFLVPSLATTYYVSPTGTGAGTISNPMSFTTAIGKTLTVGDSIVLRGGTYYFTAKQNISRSGTADKYLNIVAYSGEVPVFDFRALSYGSSYPGVNMSGSYVHLKGVVIQGAGDNGMIVNGSNNFIENCTFRWNCDSGLQMKTGSDNYILNCDSYENFDYQTGGLSSPDFGGNADGFADKQYSNTGTNKYKGCRSWSNSDDGWDHYEKIGNTQYDSCWCYANGPATYDMKNHIRFKTDSASWFVNFASTNYVVTNYGNGNGFKLGGNYTAHNAVLHDCISVMNTVKGFDQNNDAGTMTIYNCTGYANNPDFGFSNSSYGTLIVKNNATLGSKSSNKFSANAVTQSNNSWNSGFSCTAADFLSVDYSQMLNDRQADGSLPEIEFLHLKSTSGMIDKGLNLGYSFSGLAPDLGAFEYQVSTAVPDIQKAQLKLYVRENQLIVENFQGNIEMFDVLGKKLGRYYCDGNQRSIDITNLKKGVYLIKPFDAATVYQSVKVIID
jgi:hypothetical protein